MGQKTVETTNLRFTESHEWILVDGTLATVGVSDYAQQELGDIVFVELPEVGKSVAAGDEACVLESTKAAADVYSPVSGEIVEVNSALEEASGLVNDSPQDKGWLFKLKLSNPSEVEALMDEAGYQGFIG